jgi:hypothetical protein
MRQRYRFDTFLRSRDPGPQTHHFVASQYTTDTDGPGTYTHRGSPRRMRSIPEHERLRDPTATHLMRAWLSGYWRGLVFCRNHPDFTTTSPLPWAAGDIAECSGTAGSYPAIWGGDRGPADGRVLQDAERWGHYRRLSDAAMRASDDPSDWPTFADVGECCGPWPLQRHRWTPSKFAALWCWLEGQHLGMTASGAARAVTVARIRARRLLRVTCRRHEDMALAVGAWARSAGLRAPRRLPRRTGGRVGDSE